MTPVKAAEERCIDFVRQIWRSSEQKKEKFDPSRALIVFAGRLTEVQLLIAQVTMKNALGENKDTFEVLNTTLVQSTLSDMSSAIALAIVGIMRVADIEKNREFLKGLDFPECLI